MYVEDLRKTNQVNVVCIRVIDIHIIKLLTLTLSEHFLFETNIWFINICSAFYVFKAIHA